MVKTAGRSFGRKKLLRSDCHRVLSLALVRLLLTRTALGVREERIASPAAKVRRGRSVGRRAASLGDIPSSLSSSLVVVVVELLAPVKK